MNTNVFKSDSKYLASGPWLTPTSPEFLNRLPMWIWKSQSFFLQSLLFCFVLISFCFLSNLFLFCANPSISPFLLLLSKYLSCDPRERRRRFLPVWMGCLPEPFWSKSLEQGVNEYSIGNSFSFTYHCISYLFIFGARAFAVSGGYSVAVVCGLLISVASLVSSRGSRCSGFSSSPGLSCPEACGSSWTTDWTCVPCLGRQILIHWTTREALFLNIYFIVCLF